jgi:hypothetical protein
MTMTRGKLTTRLAPAATAIAAMACVAAVNVLNEPRGDEPSRAQVKAAGGTTTTETLVYPGANVLLAPPPDGVVPRITAPQAFQAYVSSGVFPNLDRQAKSPVDIRLVQFSDNTQGAIQPDNSVQLTYQNVLAWAVMYHGVPYQGISNPPKASRGASVLQDIVTVIDANSGKLLEAFADVQG